MAYRDTDLGSDVRHRPGVASAKIMAAFVEGGTIEGAAKRLGVTGRTVIRWIEELGLSERIAKARWKVRRKRRELRVNPPSSTR